MNTYLPTIQLHDCSFCLTVQPVSQDLCRCCGRRISRISAASSQHAWSFLLTGAILYFPANLLPIMHTEQLGENVDATIASGVLLLWDHGSWFIAGIIFIASLLVPLAKLLALCALCMAQHHTLAITPAQKIRIYRITEFVGRWSMVDVFVVGFLAALVQMGNLVTIRPGPAALAFAGMVLATMLSANSLNPRIYWATGEHS